MATVCTECEGRGYTIPNEADEDEHMLDFIERCIVCNVYTSNREAAMVLSMIQGRELRWAKPDGLLEYQPYLVR